MKRLFLFLLLVLAEAAGLRVALAGDGDGDLARKMPPISISVVPTYQRWTHDGARLSEFSIPVAAQLRLRPNLGVNVRISQASAEGDDLEQLSGWTDVQVAFDYLVRLTDSRLIVNLGLNLPTGKSRLSDEASRTAFQLGLSQYDFQVPYFGQGLHIAPGIAWIKALSPGVVVGVGASYHYKGAFEPISDLPQKYDWGDEFLITAGGEFQLARSLSFSADVTLTRYGADKIDGNTVYDAGNLLTVRVQFHKNLRVHDLWLSARYRNVGTSEGLVGGVLQPQAARTFPGLVELAGRYRMRLSPALHVSLLAEGTRYEASLLSGVLNVDPSEKINVYGVGIAPEVTLTPALTVPLKASYSFGSLNGLEVGLGVVAIL